MKTFYELRHIKNSNDRNLTKALVIYSHNIEPVLRTDTREIIFWLDNYNKAFNDSFYLLGLFQNDEIIGFSQLAYFQDEKIVFVDYIVIEKEYRKNNTFYEFLDQIKEFFIKENIVFNYIVGEVGYFNESKEPTENTRSLIRLLKISGFGVVKTNYYQPMLGKNNYESELQSVLMIYTPNDLKKIKKETFLLIIDTIYYKHYKRWFDKFFTEKEQSVYNVRLTQLFTKIEVEIKRKEFIEINGYSNIFSYNSLPNKRGSSRVVRFLVFLIVFIAISIILGAILVLLKKKYDIDEKSLTFIFVASIIVMLITSRFFFKSIDNDSVTEVVEKVIKGLK